MDNITKIKFMHYNKVYNHIILCTMHLIILGTMHHTIQLIVILIILYFLLYQYCYNNSVRQKEHYHIGITVLL